MRILLLFALIFVNCGGEKMTLVNSENFTGFGASPAKTMKIYEKDVSVLGNLAGETNPANLTEFNEALFNTQHNVKMLMDGVVTANATLNFSNYTDLQNYLNDIRRNDYGITITIDGSGYSGEILYITNIAGSGYISISWGTATDDLERVYISNIQNNLTLNGIEIDGTGSDEGIYIDNSKYVSAVDCVVTNVDPIISNSNSFVSVSNLLVNSGVVDGFYCTNNGFINVASVNASSSNITGIVYIASNGGRIKKMSDLTLFTTGANFESSYSGGLIWGHFGLGSEAKTSFATKTISVPNTRTTKELNQIIKNAGPYIPVFAIINISLEAGTYAGSDSVDLLGFFGGGEIVLDGVGDSTILPALRVMENRSKSRVQQLKVEGSTASDRLTKLWYNTSKVELVSVTHNENSGGSAVYECIEIKGCPTAVVETCVITGKIGISVEEQSHVYSDGNSGLNTDYGLQAITGGVITKNGTQPTGSIANENTATGGIIR